MSRNYIPQARQLLSALDIDDLARSGILPGHGKDFFPVVNYPPTIMVEDTGSQSAPQDQRISRDRPLTGYLHIPFCPSRCTYCHWITKTKTPSNEVDLYIQHLIREMQLQTQLRGLKQIPLRSVLWGGGTPTYLNARQLEVLLEAYHQYFDLDHCSQFSVEAEPGTLTGKQGMERLRVMRDYGVDRISLGVQSFDDTILKQMGRAHNHQQTLESLDNIRRAGFDNSYIDLIYGYPGQTIEQWQHQLLQAVTLDIDGFQLFRLRITPTGARQGTIVNILEKKPDQFHHAEDIYLMKALGKIIAQDNGFYEFQRRIFSKTAQSSSHYLRDWFVGLYDILGVGVSAWSQLNGEFTVNISDTDLQKYYQIINQGQLPVRQQKIQSMDDFLRRSFILPLKNTYLDKHFFQQTTAQSAYQTFAHTIDYMKQWQLIHESERGFELTSRGAFFADEVCTQFFDARYIPFADTRQLRQTLDQGNRSMPTPQARSHAAETN